MRPLTVGSRIGSGQQQAFSWIGINDLVRGIDFILSQPKLSGPVSLVSPQCVTQQELSKSLGRVLRKPSSMATPAWLLRLILGEMADDLLLEGQNSYPTRLIDSWFQFLYPDIESALQDLFNTRKETVNA